MVSVLVPISVFLFIPLCWASKHMFNDQQYNYNTWETTVLLP